MQEATRSFRIALFSLLFAFVPRLASAEPVPPSLPDRIVVKTPTRTFTETQYFAVEGGRIWVRPMSVPEGKVATWKLLGGSGMPRRKNGDAFTPPPAPIRHVVGDLRFIIAIDENRRVYDVQFEPFDAEIGDDEVDWMDKWGMPFRLLPELVHIPFEYRAVDTSLLMNNYSEDIDGNVHHILLIHTLYVLEADGTRFRFNDPWLPVNPFEMRFSSPERGRFIVRNFASSGSTVLVVDDSGRLFTRLIDYDTMGGNPGIRYSHERRTRLTETEHPFVSLQTGMPWWFDTRSLPGEPWKPQSAPPGKYTDKLAVVQTGRGNAARELRVEGLDPSGSTGYWSKPLYGEPWTFVKTGLPLQGEVLDVAKPIVRGEDHGVNLDGAASFVDARINLDAKLSARLVGMNFDYDDIVVELGVGARKPAKLLLRFDGTFYPVDGKSDRHTTGAILVPRDVRESGDSDVASLAEHFFPRRAWTPVDIQVTPERVIVSANPKRNLSLSSFAMSFERTPVAPVEAPKP